MTNTTGSSECTPCSPNQYASLSGSSGCEACDEETYSLVGSEECLEKVECGFGDFLPVVGECVDGEFARISTEHSNKGAVQSERNF